MHAHYLTRTLVQMRKRIEALEAEVDRLKYGPQWADACRQANYLGTKAPSFQEFLDEIKR